MSDTGQGISPEFLPYTFDRFRQADGTITRRHGGLGLGLAIVRHLIELHGGSVHAESPGEGHGATFIISIPCANAQAGARVQIKENENLLPEEDTSAHPGSLISIEGLQVLLVDDDEDTLQMLTAILTERGARVEAVASAAEALESLEWYKADVLVSDLAMPEEDGYSLISKVREMNLMEGRQIPAIALTAYARIEDRVKALSAGFNMFLPKPVEPDELIQTIASLIESTAQSIAKKRIEE